MTAISPTIGGVGPLLTHARRQHGVSQQRLADALCAAAGVATVSRHEISRWERGERIPTPFWLGWLSEVLGIPITRLERATARSRDYRVGVNAAGAAAPAAGVTAVPIARGVIAVGAPGTDRGDPASSARRGRGGAASSRAAESWPWRLIRVRRVIDETGRIILHPLAPDGTDIPDAPDAGSRYTDVRRRLAALA